MTTNLYQGDPKIFIGAEGAYLKFINGQPIMDAGLENYVIIKLFTRRRSKTDRKPWVGNLVFDDQAQHIGSDFEAGFDGPITIGLLEAQEKQAKKALQSMIDDNLASDIEVTLTNPTGYRIDMTVLIKRPNLPDSELVLIRNGANWLIQDLDPVEPDPPEPDPIPYGFGNYEFGDKKFGTGD